MDMPYQKTNSGIVRSLEHTAHLSLNQIDLMAAIYQFTEHGIVILDANESFYHFFSIKQYDIIDPLLYSEHTNPSKHTAILQKLYDQARYGESIHETFLAAPINRLHKWIQLDASPYHAELGSSVYLAFHTDISQYKDMQLAYEYEREFYQRSPESVTEYIFEYDLAKDILSIFSPQSENSLYKQPACLQSFHLDRFIKSSNADLIFHPDDYPTMQNVLLQKSSKESEFRADFTGSGHYSWYQFKTCSRPDNNETVPQRILGTFWNIDFLKKGKQPSIKTQQMETILRSMIERIILDDYDYIAFWDTCSDHYIIFTHNNITTPMPLLSGEHFTEELERYIRNFVTAQDKKETLSRIRLPIILSELERCGEYSIYNSIIENDEISYKELRFIFMDPEQKTVFLTRKDITRIHKEEEQKSKTLKKALSAAEAANDAKTNFLSRISHDIRTPMNAIIGMTAIASYKHTDPDMVKYCLERINEASRYLMTLINDILDMSKIESGKMQLRKSYFDMHQFLSNIESIAGQQAFDYGINFTASIDSSVRHIYIGDSLRLNQIMINLLSNALNFTQSDGSVNFNIKEVRRSTSQAELVFTIKDNGCGMSKDFQKIMYHPFEQEATGNARNQVGTGLGLSIVRNIVELMNGNILAESEPGCGTTFTVSLPFDIPDIKEELSLVNAYSLWNDSGKALDEIDLHQFFGLRILLVEDNEINLEIAEIFLKDSGFLVDSAKNGQEAIEKYALSKPNTYFAILMDIRMPVVDGLTATKTIRGMHKEDSMTIPIIAMSANAFEEDKQQARQAGMTGYLVKPVSREKLLRLLNYIIIM